MPTILLVDDHDDIRDMMKRRLQMHGYNVVTAVNGLEAVLATAQAAPSLILMDINMPELDGIEATMQIRAADPEQRIPVIALTAYALPGDQERATAAGCDGFHPKPVDFDILFAQIHELIGDTSVPSESTNP
ncbi:Response regulator receiver domain-containing protein [Neorhodopirellula lusitana]|uniref:Response regulator receiver domain-containing protein n=1 Tax=Neorhodopirellula lusitana TaxID=445327 RepID=A0ABY1QJI4_9BACT|nr:response regulator [Neorhodopirellula lusitana]SMP72461.1 Response regulator receiver domain-containing protein [Neorhodopirellula lusitana]